MANYPNYDPLKSYCLLEPTSQIPRLLDRSENERYIALIPNVSGDRHSRSRQGFSMPLNVESFTDVVQGHSFGWDVSKCDIILDDTAARGVSDLHFRLQLDYTQKGPELDIVNCSPNGIRVEGRLITQVGQRTRLYQGDTLHVSVGPITLRIWYPFLDLTNPKLASRWLELRTTAWSLLRPSLRNALLPANQRGRYLEAEEDCIWQDISSPRFLPCPQTIALSKGRIAQRTGFLVVLKKIRDKEGDAKEERQNKNEKNAMTSLRHENLVAAFRDSWGQDNVVVIEHSPHNSIPFFLKSQNGTRLKEDAVMEIALQMLTALSYLETQNLAHRDVKPSKIIVFRTDPPIFKLTDFGGEDLSDTKSYISDRISDQTIDYVAPEIFEYGSQTSAQKTDVWSLGIILWELLVGDPPIPFCEEMSFGSAFRAILNWRPRVKDLESWGVSDEGQDLVLRMCERNWRVRPGVGVLSGDVCFDYLEGVRKNEPCDLQDSVL